MAEFDGINACAPLLQFRHALFSALRERKISEIYSARAKADEQQSAKVYGEVRDGVFEEVRKPRKSIDRRRNDRDDDAGRVYAPYSDDGEDGRAAKRGPSSQLRGHYHGGSDDEEDTLLDDQDTALDDRADSASSEEDAYPHKDHRTVRWAAKRGQAW